MSRPPKRLNGPGRMQSGIRKTFVSPLGTRNQRPLGPAMPPPRSEAEGSHGSKHLSDIIQEEETSVPPRAIHLPDWSVHEMDHSSEAWVLLCCTAMGTLMLER